MHYRKVSSKKFRKLNTRSNGFRSLTARKNMKNHRMAIKDHKMQYMTIKAVQDHANSQKVTSSREKQQENKKHRCCYFVNIFVSFVTIFVPSGKFLFHYEYFCFWFHAKNNKTSLRTFEHSSQSKPKKKKFKPLLRK